MGLTYYKRFRMEIDLEGRDLPRPELPRGYRLLAWDPSLLEAHAEAKYLSFHDEIDAHVFPCLGEYAGCCRLMREITSKEAFVPQATWLLVYTDGLPGGPESCGTIQGIRDPMGLGAVQNLGITSSHRNRGLGSSLLFEALRGFREAGLPRVFLEVTADNQRAIRLYQRWGFVAVKTLFKAVEVECA